MKRFWVGIALAATLVFGMGFGAQLALRALLQPAPVMAQTNLVVLPTVTPSPTVTLEPKPTPTNTPLVWKTAAERNGSQRKPTGPTTKVVARPQTQEQYAEAMVDILSTQSETMWRLSDLLDEFDIESRSWRNDVVAEVANLRSAENRMKRLSPPAHLQAIHSTALRATAHCTRAGALVISAIDRLDVSLMYDALDATNECTLGYADTTDMIDAYLGY